MKYLLITALILFTLAGPALGKASADWDFYGGGYSGSSDFYAYFGW